MEIKICGPGCRKCNEAYANALAAAERTGKAVSVTKVTDLGNCNAGNFLNTCSGGGRTGEMCGQERQCR